MKTLLYAVLPAMLLIFSQSADAQSIAVRANFSVNTITDFDEGFLGGGIGVEGIVGRKWSVGSDFSWAKSEDISLFHFNPAIRYYFRRSLQGFFLGIGGTAYQFKRDNDVPIGYPLELSRGSTAIVGGPEFQFGMQARLQETVTMGVKVGVVGFMDTDLDENAGLNVQFTVGWLF